LGTEPIKVRKIILITGCNCQIDSALHSDTYLLQGYFTVWIIKTILQMQDSMREQHIQETGPYIAPKSPFVEQTMQHIYRRKHRTAHGYGSPNNSPRAQRSY
jgi:hypothetical protein